MRICYSCMKEVNNEKKKTCPYCGEPMELPNREQSGLKPGTVLQDKYLVGKMIGSGGFGNTYVGSNRFLQTKVAIKEFFPGHLSVRAEDGATVSVSDAVSATRFGNGLNQFLQEARAIAGLKDVRGVVEVQSFFQENDTGYMVMEFLEGMDVKTILKRRGSRMDYEWCRTVILTVLDTLREVHRRGVIHRDIAPDNVYVTKDGVIKLIDFGAAKLAAEVAQPNAEIVLKQGYAPIEQYSRGAKQGPYTDLYAVAAMFYRMLTGVKPSPAVERIQDDSMPSPRELGLDVPEKADRAIMKCLSIQPENRLQSADEFMEALDGQDFVPIYEPEWILPKEKGKKKSTALKVLLIFAILAVIGGGAAGTIYFLQPEEKVQNTFGTENVKRMPQLIGLTKDEAMQKLREIGFTNITVEYDYNPSVPVDEVTEQDIAGGTTYQTGDGSFSLRLSGGRQKFTMPDCSTMNYQEAYAWFSERGAAGILTLEWSDDYNSTYVEENDLIVQNTPAGSIVDTSDGLGTLEGSVVYSYGYIYDWDEEDEDEY